MLINDELINCAGPRVSRLILSTPVALALASVKVMSSIGLCRLKLAVLTSGLACLFPLCVWVPWRGLVCGSDFR